MRYIMEHYIWAEKYRPCIISHCILPEAIKDLFYLYVEQKNIPNLLLSGPPGIGKTTIAKAMLEELDCDVFIINGSLNGNIDTLRNDIQRFASTVSLREGRKYVILDEADYLNPQSTMPALRNFMDQFAINCGFIFTCNYPNKIIPALRSRLTEIQFKIPKEESAKLAKQFMDRALEILELEKVSYVKSVVARIISNNFPDWRKCMNELQRSAMAGQIDPSSLLNTSSPWKILSECLTSRDFSKARKWAAENTDIDSSVLFRLIYDNAEFLFKTESIPQLVLTLGKYQYQHPFCADPEINVAACLAEIMAECQFK